MTFQFTEGADLETCVGEAIGAASMAWDNVVAAGVFDEQWALEVKTALLERLPKIGALDVTGKVVVVRDVRPFQDREWLVGVVDALKKRGADLILFAAGGVTVEALDEDQMRTLGWVRA